MGDAKSVVNRSVEAWAAHDIEGFMALIAPDAVFRGPGGPGGYSIQGHAAIREMVVNQMAAWPDERYEVRRQFVDGDTVITEAATTATHSAELTLATGEKLPATGRTIAHDMVEIDRVVDGKIVDSVAYYDRHAFLQQLGQLPEAAVSR